MIGLHESIIATKPSLRMQTVINGVHPLTGPVLGWILRGRSSSAHQTMLENEDYHVETRLSGRESLFMLILKGVLNAQAQDQVV